MGGYGSGRRRDWGRPFADGAFPLDIRPLQRDGLLVPGGYITLAWSKSGTRLADATGTVEGRDGRAALLRLSYQRNGEPLAQPIPVTWTACTFGGFRPWFVCACTRNGVLCGRRVAVVYGAGKVFACRHCYRLPYETQYESPAERMISKSWNVRRRLGQRTGGIAAPFPLRPRGMHEATYLRLMRRSQRANTLHWGMIAKKYGFGAGLDTEDEADDVRQN